MKVYVEPIVETKKDVNITSNNLQEKMLFDQLLDWVDNPNEISYSIYSGHVYKYDLEFKGGKFYMIKKKTRRSPLGRRLITGGKSVTREEILESIYSIREHH